MCMFVLYHAPPVFGDWYPYWYVCRAIGGAVGGRESVANQRQEYYQRERCLFPTVARPCLCLRCSPHIYQTAMPALIDSYIRSNS